MVNQKWYLTAQEQLTELRAKLKFNDSKQSFRNLYYLTAKTSFGPAEACIGLSTLTPSAAIFARIFSNMRQGTTDKRGYCWHRNSFTVVAEMNTRSQEILSIKAATDNANDYKAPLDFTFMCLTSVSGRLPRILGVCTLVLLMMIG